MAAKEEMEEMGLLQRRCRGPLEHVRVRCTASNRTRARARRTVRTVQRRQVARTLVSESRMQTNVLHSFFYNAHFTRFCSNFPACVFCQSPSARFNKSLHPDLVDR